MLLLASGRACLFLGLAVAAPLGCSDSDPGSPGNLGAGAGGRTSASAGSPAGGPANTAAGTASTAGTNGDAGTMTTGGDVTGGTASGGAPAQGGGPSAAGAAPGGGSGIAGSATGGVSEGGGSNGGGSTNGAVPIDPNLRQKCSGSNPIVCRLDAPDGNWDVTVDLGSDTAAGSSRVAAETRHYLGGARATVPGAHELVSFTANVRMEKHDGGQSAPSNILDLVIDGSAPQLRGVGIRPAPKAITVFVAGDSTLCDWVGSNSSAVNDDETGWAQALAQYFGTGVAIANYADSGETAGGFYSKFFTPAKAALEAGDYVFVQFGHNDQKDTDAVATYKTNLMKYVQDARDKQATPVLFTPVSRSAGTDANPGFAGLDDQVRELAIAEKIALIDLTVLSRNYYKTVPDKAALFADSGTHLSSLGANGVARLVASAIQGGDLPLKSFVVVK